MDRKHLSGISVGIDERCVGVGNTAALNVCYGGTGGESFSGMNHMPARYGSSEKSPIVVNDITVVEDIANDYEGNNVGQNDSELSTIQRNSSVGEYDKTPQSRRYELETDNLEKFCCVEEASERVENRIQMEEPNDVYFLGSNFGTTTHSVRPEDRRRVVSTKSGLDYNFGKQDVCNVPPLMLDYDNNRRAVAGACNGDSSNKADIDKNHCEDQREKILEMEKVDMATGTDSNIGSACTQTANNLRSNTNDRSSFGQKTVENKMKLYYFDLDDVKRSILQRRANAKNCSYAAVRESNVQVQDATKDYDNSNEGSEVRTYDSRTENGGSSNCHSVIDKVRGGVSCHELNNKNLYEDPRTKTAQWEKINLTADTTGNPGSQTDHQPDNKRFSRPCNRSFAEHNTGENKMKLYYFSLDDVKQSILQRRANGQQQKKETPTPVDTKNSLQSRELMNNKRGADFPKNRSHCSTQEENAIQSHVKTKTAVPVANEERELNRRIEARRKILEKMRKERTSCKAENTALATSFNNCAEMWRLVQLSMDHSLVDNGITKLTMKVSRHTSLSGQNDKCISSQHTCVSFDYAVTLS